MGEENVDGVSEPQLSPQMEHADGEVVKPVLMREEYEAGRQVTALNLLPQGVSHHVEETFAVLRTVDVEAEDRVMFVGLLLLILIGVVAVLLAAIQLFVTILECALCTVGDGHLKNRSASGGFGVVQWCVSGASPARPEPQPLGRKADSTTVSPRFDTPPFPADHPPRCRTSGKGVEVVVPQPPTVQLFTWGVYRRLRRSAG